MFEWPWQKKRRLEREAEEARIRRQRDSDTSSDLSNPINPLSPMNMMNPRSPMWWALYGNNASGTNTDPITPPALRDETPYPAAPAPDPAEPSRWHGSDIAAPSHSYSSDSYNSPSSDSGGSSYSSGSGSDSGGGSSSGGGAD